MDPQNHDKPWTPDEDTLLRKLNHLAAKDLSGIFQRSASAIGSRRVNLGLKKIVRMGDEEEGLLRREYLGYTPLEDIQKLIFKQFGIKRSIGVLRQKLLHLELRRDARRSRLINRFGLENAPLHESVEEIRARLLAQERALRKAQKDTSLAEAKLIITNMLRNLSLPGASRKVEFRTALAAGCTLEMIGRAVGLTRERVRQVIYEVRGRSPYQKKSRGQVSEVRRQAFFTRPNVQRDIICEQCGDLFTYTTKQGVARKRFCLDCAAKRTVANRDKFLIKARALNAEAKEERARVRGIKVALQNLPTNLIEELLENALKKVKERNSGSQQGSNTGQPDSTGQ